MTPELLNLLTPEERAAWALCEAATPGPWTRDSDGAIRSSAPTEDDWLPSPQVIHASRYPGEDGLTFAAGGDYAFITGSRDALPAALTTIAALRAELCAVSDLIQEVGVLGIASTMDAVVVSGQPSARDLLTWAAKAMDAWPEERQALRAEVAKLREMMAEQQRAFIVGLDLAQRTADVEIAELRATLANDRGEGTPPSEGWRRNATGDGMWERILAMRPSWTSEQEGEPTDTLIVGRDDDVHWRWERYVDNGAGQRLVGGVGGIECARTAMKAADDAVEPEVVDSASDGDKGPGYTLLLPSPAARNTGSS